MTVDRILALIESGDELAAMLQTLRLNRTPEHAQRVCLKLHAMAREADRLAHDLADGIEP
jgi:hypothetical protein